MTFAEALTDKALKKLERLLHKCSPLPWRQDDGNFFSGPLTDERHRRIMAHLKSGESDSDWNHPDDDPKLDGQPLGFVGNVPQFTKNFQADLDVIVGCVNAAPALLQATRERDELKAFLREHGPTILCARVDDDAPSSPPLFAAAQKALLALLEKYR